MTTFIDRVDEAFRNRKLLDFIEIDGGNVKPGDVVLFANRLEMRIDEIRYKESGSTLYCVDNPELECDLEVPANKCRAVGGPHSSLSKWHERHDNLYSLAFWLDESVCDFRDTSSVVRFIEKPWKWTGEFLFFVAYELAEGQDNSIRELVVSGEHGFERSESFDEILLELIQGK